MAARFDERQKAKAIRAKHFQDRADEKELLEKIIKEQHKEEMERRVATLDERTKQRALLADAEYAAGRSSAMPGDMPGEVPRCSRYDEDVPLSPVPAALKKPPSTEVEAVPSFALHEACETVGSLRALEEALARQPQAVFECDKLGDLPLHRLCKNRCLEVVSMAHLLIQMHPTALEARGNTRMMPLHVACRHTPSTELVAYLIERDSSALQMPAQGGDLPVHLAMENPNIAASEAIMDLVLEHWPEAVFGAGSQGSALHHASRWLPTADRRFQAILDAWPEGCQKKNSHGQLPLHVALLNETHGDGPLHIIAGLLRAYPKAMESDPGLHDRIARRMVLCEDASLQRRLGRYLPLGSPRSRSPSKVPYGDAVGISAGETARISPVYISPVRPECDSPPTIARKGSQDHTELLPELSQREAQAESASGVLDQASEEQDEHEVGQQKEETEEPAKVEYAKMITLMEETNSTLNDLQNKYLRLMTASEVNEEECQAIEQEIAEFEAKVQHYVKKLQLAREKADDN